MNLFPTPLSPTQISIVVKAVEIFRRQQQAEWERLKSRSPEYYVAFDELEQTEQALGCLKELYEDMRKSHPDMAPLAEVVGEDVATMLD